MTKHLFTGAALAALLCASPGVANAGLIGFDLDGAGTLFGPNGMPGNTTPIADFQGAAVSAYTINVSLGADKTLGNGDTFSEAFTLNLNNARNAAHTNIESYVSGLSSKFYIDVALTGTISNYNSGADAATGVNAAGDVVNTLGDDIFTIAFTGTSMTAYYDPDAVHGNADDVNIATLAVIGGGADAFSFENPTATSDLGVTMLFTSMKPGVWFESDFATDLSTFVPLHVVLGLADSSVNLLPPVTGSNPPPALHVQVADNGTTAQISVVPEPSTIMLLGFGLIGMAGVASRRRA